MKDKLYRCFPVFLQELMISVFNFNAYRVRYGRKYQEYRALFLKNRTLSREELTRIQTERFDEFLRFSKEHTKHYQKIGQVSLPRISELPILRKETLRKKSAEFFTVSKKEGVISKTGGTTGKSLEILFTSDNMQERFAMLDDFRSRFGYELGKKTAWFSGKSLLTSRDLKNNIFWKTDRWHRVRYYSTFHISDHYLKYYVEDLIRYKPEYLIGFPSTIHEIAKYGFKNGYVFPENTVKAIFPTAETVTEFMRRDIETFFKSRMFDQYASSEGAPFIFECTQGNLHLELQSGVFEVLDDEDQPAVAGRLIVTSFTTEGTPLIRYDIGDSIILKDAALYCSCGNQNPMVQEILGRIDDFIYSPENGKINLGNVSNTLKDTKGILKFQAVQDSLDTVDLFVAVDDQEFTEDIKKVFLRNWRDRIGEQMHLNLHFTQNFSVENSGKFRLVKNNIKHLL